MTNHTLLISYLSVLLFWHTGIVQASSNTKKEKCEKVNNKITKIQKKMRNGYSVKQGIKYNKRLNKLYKKQFEACL
ncbi:hypothetical protein [Photobacterium sp. DNB22_13_2]